MSRSRNDGLSKRCGCPRRSWSKCSHPWHFDFYHGRKYRFSLHTQAGKPRGYVMSKREAEGLRDQIRSQIRSGTFRAPGGPPEPAAPGRPTFGEVTRLYLDRHVHIPSRTPGAAKTMAWHIEALCRSRVPAGGGTTIPLRDKPFDAITKADIESIRREREAQAARPSVDPRRPPGIKRGVVGTNRLLARLRHVFTWAIEEGFLDATPFKRHGVTVIRLDSRAETPRHRRLHPGEEDRLVHHAAPHLQALIVAALETGCRVGELLSLQWADVRYTDTEGGHPEATWLDLPAARTKTHETRSVPVTTRLRAVLEMRRQDPAGRDHPPSAAVFGNAVGEPLRSIKTAWRTTCARAGIEDLHFHDLRREFASRLRETPGVSDHHVRDWLGHANITTTSRYLATTPTSLDRARRVFEAHRRDLTTGGGQPPPLSRTEGDSRGRPSP